MTRKSAFSEEWDWLKFNNLGLALGTNLKFYTSVSKGLKLKVRQVWGLAYTFVEVTGEKLVGGPFYHPHSILIIVKGDGPTMEDTTVPNYYILRDWKNVQLLFA